MMEAHLDGAACIIHYRTRLLDDAFGERGISWWENLMRGFRHERAAQAPNGLAGMNLKDCRRAA